MHIKKQHVIGVGADGVEVFEHGRLCWLQVRGSEFLLPSGLSLRPFCFLSRHHIMGKRIGITLTGLHSSRLPLKTKYTSLISCYSEPGPLRTVFPWSWKISTYWRWAVWIDQKCCSVTVMVITVTSMSIVHLAQVIHDCRAIAGCLTVQFGVKLTNVFDTQVHVQCCGPRSRPSWFSPVCRYV